MTLTLPGCVGGDAEAAVSEAVLDKRCTAHRGGGQGQPHQGGAESEVDNQVTAVRGALIVERLGGVVIGLLGWWWWWGAWEVGVGGHG